MDDRDQDYDDMTDTSEESSSEPTSSSGEGLFKGNVPYVLELHDIRKDDPAMPPAPANASDPLLAAAAAAAKVKKHRKKKRASDADAAGRRLSVTSDSASDASSVAPSATDVNKEQFYDARESFHAIPENEVPTIAQMVAQSESVPDPKAPGLATSDSQSTAATTQKEPSAVMKPTAPP